MKRKKSENIIEKKKKETNMRKIVPQIRKKMSVLNAKRYIRKKCEKLSLVLK